MSLPFFYIEELDFNAASFTLSEETSKHVIQVLRMKSGEELQLVDGKGNIVRAVIKEKHKKKCIVDKLDLVHIPAPSKKIVIGISLVKNNSRFEWFLEKSTEIGVTEIIPLLCTRTEKQHFRFDRMKGILVSAMLQSKQGWLPQLREPVELKSLLKENPAFATFEKFIAHCEDDETKLQLKEVYQQGSALILIGPEGDFTSDEINELIERNFTPVALGNTRLRTETAGIVAAVLLNN